MIRNVVIGGGTGFIGSALSKLLRREGYGVTVVSRVPGPQRISWADLGKNGLPPETTAVVNLAGQNVLDPTRRWTKGFKQNVWASRVNSTSSLAEAIIEAKAKPKVFITISGVGIYKPCASKEYTEDYEGKPFDFLSNLCHDWEAAGNLPIDIGVRRVILRSGVVLGRNGGMVKQLWLPFYFGMGGPVGDGNQFLPWIHIDDITRLILFAIENESVKGVLNGVSPEIITNKQFSKALARAMWRPASIPVPVFLLNLAFSEERAKMMTEGQKVIPKRTQAYGFKYCYPDVQTACQSLVRNAK
ncbi:Epimerase family protein SDR39U1 [Gryllus bimaculatus]|nr:Epimerase family protein SDR39U1 [Gryllus bimaculatus]